MIDVNVLLQKLDDGLEKVSAKKEPESFLNPLFNQIQEYQKGIRQVQAQFGETLYFNETSSYPKFLSCGLLEVKGKNGANQVFEPFYLPRVYPFPPKSLYIESERDGQFLRETLMRLLSSAPLVQLEVILVDALSLGGIFNLARKLLDKDNDFIYQQRILTESKEIEEALKHLYEYLKVNLQEKLAGYKDFAHYNEIAKDPLPLKALFLSGIDALNKDALYYLEKIMRFGSQNGVLSFVNLESEKNKSLEEWKRYAEPFKDNGFRFKCLDIEVVSDSGIKSQHMQEFADTIKAYYKQKKEVKRELKDLQREGEFWTKSSQDEVVVPVGWDINHKEVRFEIGKAQNHTLICGRSGSGKSNFLHVLIQNLAFYYAPNEVQLFLLDYKEGVEFNAYTNPNPLEHARLVSVESSVGFGISFLSWLCKEMQERAGLFKQFNVKDLQDYRKHEKMPRLIVVIDEFQVLFSSTSKETDAVNRDLTDLLKKGRSYGIHLILSTQTMRGTNISSSLKAQIANRIALSMDAEDSDSVLGDDVACELVRSEGIFNNNGGHKKYHTKMSIPKAPDDFKAFIQKIHIEFNQRGLDPIERKIYNGEERLKIPNILKANAMRLHLGKEVDYEQKDLIVEFENNESHLLVVSNNIESRATLMRLLAQNIKSADKEWIFCNAEKRLMRYFDAKEYGIAPRENALNALDSVAIPNSVLMIDNLNEAKELHDKAGVEKLKSFLEKATDNEQYCVIFAHDLKQISSNYNPSGSLKDLLKSHFKQCLAFKCNGENLRAIKSLHARENDLPPLNERNALFIDASKDSVTEFRPFTE